MNFSIRRLYQVYHGIHRTASARNTLNHSKKRTLTFTPLLYKNDNDDLDLDENDKYRLEYQQIVSKYLSFGTDHCCFIIHPYVKWGPQKVRDTDPQKQLQECISLVRTLESWDIHGSVTIPLDTLDRKKLFSKGHLEKLKRQIRGDARITALFINIGTLKTAQKEELEIIFEVPIFDRYTIVMLILKMHATSKHAKLQVALAEVLHMASRLKRGMDNTGIAYDTRKLILQTREKRIRNEIQKLRKQREQQRNRRKEIDYPVVAVIGYTNAGKTSLIKRLSLDKNLEPRNQLFATLDVTLHAGTLPCKLEVLYVDTVGFISNIPTTLIECFMVTLEDALYADVVMLVEDLSNDNLLHQRNHMMSTLNDLSDKIGADILEKVLTVGNKCDLVKELDNNVLLKGELIVSAETGHGVEELKEQVEDAVLKNTNRSIISLRVPIGGDEVRWLYKNSTVIETQEDNTDSQYNEVKVVITPKKIQQFKHYFVRSAR